VHIKEAIERELVARGQIFFLHNRIESIRGVYDYLAKLVPPAKIAVAHGQMRRELEEVMTDFVDRQTDVLLCTADHRVGPRHPQRQHHPVDRATTSVSRSSTRSRPGGPQPRRAYAYLCPGADGR